MYSYPEIPVTAEEDEAFDLKDAFQKLCERERAGDIGALTYEWAMGQAVATGVAASINTSNVVQLRPRNLRAG